MEQQREMAAAFIGVARHRMGRDGKGVTTLAAFHSCSLHCKYCLNPACLDSKRAFPQYTPQQLYDKISIDNLYFLATGGGVCFGGGGFWRLLRLRLAHGRELDA